MKIFKNVILTIFLLYVVNIAYSQVGNANNMGGLNELNELVRERQIEESMLKDMKYSKMNYFLDRDWKAGVMYTKGGNSISGMLYRYNVYTDQIEFRSFVNPESVDIISIGSKKFIYSDYLTDENNTGSGFFELIVNGDCKLLIKRQMSFKEGTSDQEAYGSSSSTKIVERYYIKKDDQPAVYVERNKVSIANILSDKNEFEEYINNKLLIIVTEKKLIELINYYNKI